MSPSETAILVASISSLVALLVFALTQYLTYRRERTKHLTEKLEQLFTLVVAEENMHVARLEGYLKGEELEASTQHELTNFTQMWERTMLVTLYFQDLVDDAMSFDESIREVVNEILQTKKPRQFKEFIALLDKIHDAAHVIKRRIVEDRHPLTHTSKGTFKRLWERASAGE